MIWEDGGFGKRRLGVCEIPGYTHIFLLGSSRAGTLASEADVAWHGRG